MAERSVPAGTRETIERTEVDLSPYLPRFERTDLAAALVNLAHVIGLILFESVRYRGFFRGFFRTITLTFTPLAALANLVLWLTS